MSAAAQACLPLQAQLDYLCDPHTGMIAALDAVPSELDLGPIAHLRARLCRVGALQQAGPAERSYLATGTDPSDALRRAVCGAMARYCAAAAQPEPEPSSASQAPFATLAPEQLALFDAAQYARPGFRWTPFDAHVPLRWYPAYDPQTAREVHVPAALVCAPYGYTRGSGDVPIIPPGRTGLCCAPQPARALCEGLYDALSQHAAAAFWLGQRPLPQVLVESLDDGAYELVSRLESAGHGVTLFDASAGGPVTSLIGCIRYASGPVPGRLFAVASHLSGRRAVQELLLQLAEVDLYAKSLAARMGEGGPPPPKAQSLGGRLAQHLFPAGEGLHAFADGSPVRVEADELPERQPAGGGQELADLLGGLTALGLTPLFSEITTADVASLGLRAFRVLVPELQRLYPGSEPLAAGGDRWQSWLSTDAEGRGPGASGASDAPHPFLVP